MARFNQQGFTFLTVVFAVVLIGISLSVAGQQWRMVVQRDREEELLYRGDQIKHAIEAYFRAAPGVGQGTPGVGRGIPGASQYPSCGMEGDDCFKDLLGDPTSHKKRYLRKAYKDPITNDDWLMIRTTNNRFVGVHSKSTKEPFKKANFPEEYKCFEQATEYTHWVFRFIPLTDIAGGETATPEEELCTTIAKPPSKKDD